MDDLLRQAHPAMLDGGLATELEQRGADLTGHLWSARLLIDNPTLIRDTHVAYYLAGADIGISASYQASLEGFAKLGLGPEEGSKMLKRSVEILKEARDLAWEKIAQEGNKSGRSKPLVAASIGSYGAFLADGSEYSGNYGLTVEQIKDFHRGRLLTLLEASPDVLACETLPCAIEARALAQLLKEPAVAGHKTPAWISVSMRDEEHLNSGDTVADLISGLAEEGDAGIISVGVNCSAPRVVEGALRAMRARTALPLVAYANKGEEWDGINKVWLAGTAVDDDLYCLFAEKWREAGAALIGGCCRTGPGTIRLLRSTLVKP